MNDGSWERILEFFGPYGIYLLAWILIGVSTLQRWYRNRRLGREFLDSAPVSRWEDRRDRLGIFSPRIEGRWNGRRASLTIGREKKARLMDGVLHLETPGTFRIIRRSAFIFERPFFLGGPPRIEPANPEDRDRWLTFASDRMLLDRVLADRAARAALDQVLQSLSDSVTLEKGRLEVRTRFPEGLPPRSPAEKVLNALDAARKALGQ